MRRENNIPNNWKSGEKSHERDPPSMIILSLIIRFLLTLLLVFL